MGEDSQPHWRVVDEVALAVSFGVFDIRRPDDVPVAIFCDRAHADEYVRVLGPRFDFAICICEMTNVPDGKLRFWSQSL